MGETCFNTAKGPSSNGEKNTQHCSEKAANSQQKEIKPPRIAD